MYVWPCGPPRIWSCVESTSTVPFGITRSCALGEQKPSPEMRSSTMPPRSAMKP